MIELLQHYTMSEILTFVIFLALALKSLISFFDWFQERFQKVFNIQHRKLTEKEQLEKRLQHGSQIMNNLKINQEETDDVLQKLSEKINILIESDRDDIKSYITREHHYFCYKVGWIDDFSLDCIEKRYKHYIDEGGNTFVGDLMDELRALPKKAPSQK